MERYIFCLVLFLVMSFSQQALDHRLPKDSIPISYELMTDFNIKENKVSFSGQTKIFLEILKPTVNLTLHSSYLTYNEEKTKVVFGDKTFTPQNHFLVKEHEFLILNFPEYLQPGRYNLSLEYFRIFEDSLPGMYFDVIASKIYLIASDFNPTFARRVFPCWDEPGIKATFDISIKHLANYTAISNMAVEKIINTTEIDGKILTSFKRTPLMSTYSVAFAISTLENITNPQKNITLWFRKELANDVNEAYEFILKVFSFWEKCTNITYPWPKLDIISTSRNFLLTQFDFVGNSGLTMMAEEAIFNKRRQPPSASILNDETFSILHLTLDKWLRSQVNLDSWKDKWLIDGLIIYFIDHLSYKATHDSTIVDEAKAIRHFVALIENFISNFPTGEDITLQSSSFYMYENLYLRAAELMHMLSSLISEEIFNLSIKKLLDLSKLKSISPDDFWKVMQESLNKSQVPYFDIKEKMEPFLFQVGFPMVNVERDYETGDIKLTQDCVDQNTTTDSKWWIPINYATSSLFNFSSTQVTLWMNPNENETIIRGIDPNDLVIFNIQAAVPYIVNYDKETWIELLDYMKSSNASKIHPINRAKLLIDAFWAYELGKIDKDLLKSVFFNVDSERESIPRFVTGMVIMHHTIHKEFPSEFVNFYYVEDKNSYEYYARHNKEMLTFQNDITMNWCRNFSVIPTGTR